MKETDALTKWCPFVRTLDDGAGASNRGTFRATKVGFQCIGAECMAWRYFEPKEKGLGYCGLATVPSLTE